jgi:hypothetical protein
VITALQIPRRAALAVIAALVAGASITALAESYRALVIWSAHHGVSGFWSAVWPLQIDVFVIVGELALFVALADGWTPRSRAGAWAVTVTGLAVSVAGNVGHVSSHLVTDRVTAAVPPVAAAAALAVGLGVLKRVVLYGQAARDASSAEGTGTHVAALAGATSDAAKIRYAATAAGSDDPGTVVGWLAERGHMVSPVNVRTVLRRQVASESGRSGVVSLHERVKSASG